MRFTVIFALVLALFGSADAQEFSGLARLDGDKSGAQGARRSVQVDLHLSQPVPYRVFTLDDPRRLVLDFREVDFREAGADFFVVPDWISGARFGALRPGWSRMILDLERSVVVEEAGMQVDQTDATAVIGITISASTDRDFADNAGAPDDPDWAFLMAADPAGPVEAPDDGMIVVVVDPGHGGLDPGAQHGGVNEADVMLALGLDVVAVLERMEGIRAVITRTDDVFVPLQSRVSMARAAGADLFISLHADALEGLQATGASVYTLSENAADRASQRMIERHEGGDLLAGVDLSGQSDEVAGVLQDLVRVETAAAGARFARQLVTAMEQAGAVVNSRPRRRAELAVLNAADFASVLLEVGFLSNDADRARLSTARGRVPIVVAISLAVNRWVAEEAALAPLMRQ